MRRIAIILVILLIVGLGYLTLWPVSVDPVAWESPPAPVLAGVYAPNSELARGSRLLEEIGVGPEDVAFDDAGRLYTGFIGGRIVRMELPDGEPEVFADTGGRPLGMVFDPSGRLIVADAYEGLLSIASDGSITTLATEAEGLPFGFLNYPDLAPDGTVYVTDASSKFGYGFDRQDIFEHRGRGRFMAYDPETGDIRVLLRGLQFANGVAVAPDGGSVLVAETGAYRILRYLLEGERAGEVETFADNLPGFPDNIGLSARGTLWVALPSPRLPVVDGLSSLPFLRKVAMRLPEALQPKAKRHGLVIEFDMDGRPLRSLQDPSGGVALVTSAVEHEGRLYLGSYREPSLVVVPLE